MLRKHISGILISKSGSFQNIVFFLFKAEVVATVAFFKATDNGLVT